MFGKNEIVGQKYFDQEGKLLITSLFGPTIQGEGVFAGQSAMFVRLAKCNLNCSFCDTYFDSGDYLSYEEIWNKLEQLSIGKVFPKLLVLTGGEPLLQKNISAFIEFVQEKFTYIQIESNGIIHQLIPDCTTLIISPKCSEKTNQYLMPNKKNLDRAICLKFVLSSDKDSSYNTIPAWAFEWRDKRRGEIYISPMNIYNKQPLKTKEDVLEKRSSIDETISFWEPGLLNMKENQLNHEYAAQYCIQNDFRLNLQMQLYASVP